MTVTHREFGPVVVCTAFGNETWTRVHQGTFFCSQCGATDHEEAK